MKKLFLLALWLSGCKLENTPSNPPVNKNSKLVISKTIGEQIISHSNNKTLNETSIIPCSGKESIRVNNPSVVFLSLDSAEIEKLKLMEGEDNFYTGSDDLLFYEYELEKKLDSLKIPIFRSKTDSVEMLTPNGNFLIVKDTILSLRTYFYFDGNNVKKTGLFELMDRILFDANSKN